MADDNLPATVHLELDVYGAMAQVASIAQQAQRPDLLQSEIEVLIQQEQRGSTDYRLSLRLGTRSLRDAQRFIGEVARLTGQPTL